jgi:hypothetical protein
MDTINVKMIVGLLLHCAQTDEKLKIDNPHPQTRQMKSISLWARKSGEQ